MAKKKLKPEEKEELKQEGELPKKSVRKEEDKQLLIFFIIIGLVFAGFLIPYFYVQSSKTFEYSRVDWTIEDYPNLRIFHGRFQSFMNNKVFHNIFLRIDPRKNEVETSGTFNKFKYGGIVSLSPTLNECRGEMNRVIFDLSAFLKQGIGVGNLEAATTNKSFSMETKTKYATCKTVLDRTLVIVDLGNESKVVQNEKNPYCYTIYAKDCKDISSVEKFIVKSISDFRDAREALLSQEEE